MRAVVLATLLCLLVAGCSDARFGIEPAISESDVERQNIWQTEELGNIELVEYKVSVLPFDRHVMLVQRGNITYGTHLGGSSPRSNEIYYYYAWSRELMSSNQGAIEALIVQTMGVDQLYINNEPIPLWSVNNSSYEVIKQVCFNNEHIENPDAYRGHYRRCVYNSVGCDMDGPSPSLYCFCKAIGKDTERECRLEYNTLSPPSFNPLFPECTSVECDLARAALIGDPELCNALADGARRQACIKLIDEYSKSIEEVAWRPRT